MFYERASVFYQVQPIGDGYSIRGAGTCKWLEPMPIERADYVLAAWLGPQVLLCERPVRHQSVNLYSELSEGFPFRSLGCYWNQACPPVGQSGATLYLIGGLPLAGQSSIGMPGETLVYAPIWIGLCADIAIYFALLHFGVLTIGLVKRRARRRRGRCERCGYEVRRLERCPECGASVINL